MQLDKVVSHRIAVLRPILIFGVVLVHVPGIAESMKSLGPGLFVNFAALFKNAIFRGTVPTMSLIAGFLLFSSGLDLKPMKMFKKKFMTLAVPFMIFNFGFVLFLLVVESTTGVHLKESLLHASPKDWWSILFGVYRNPINGPLHFIRDMLVTISLVPLLSLAIRSAPMMGLATIIIIFGMDQDGYLIIRGTSFILFYIGGMAAVYKWNVLALDKYAPLCLGAFLSIAITNLVLRNSDNTFLIVSAPFLIWPAASLLHGTKFETYALKCTKYSFFVFVTHVPVLTLIWWFVSNHARFIPLPVYWFSSQVITIGFLMVVYNVSMKLFPRVLSIAIGSRDDNKVTVLTDRELMAIHHNSHVASNHAVVK
jgi:succinoglycan biosynthesis protein ExoH